MHVIDDVQLLEGVLLHDFFRRPAAAGITGKLAGVTLRHTSPYPLGDYRGGREGQN